MGSQQLYSTNIVLRIVGPISFVALVLRFFIRNYPLTIIILLLRTGLDAVVILIFTAPELLVGVFLFVHLGREAVHFLDVTRM